MRALKYIGLFILSFLFWKLNAQDPPNASAKIKAVFIYNFTRYFEWENQADKKEFTIGLLAGDSSIKEELEKLALVKKIGNLPIRIVLFNAIENITNTDILYVDLSKEPKYKTSKKARNTLVISENDKDLNNAMIAFVMDGKKQKFALNEVNIKNSGLKMHPDLKNLAIVISGTDKKADEAKILEWKSVFDKFSDALKNNTAEIKLSKQEAAEVMATMDANKKTISEKEQKLSEQESEIKNQQKDLIGQKIKIDEQLKSILTQEEMLKLQQHKIEVTIQQNKAKVDELASLFKFVDAQNIIVDRQKKRVNKQKSILEDQQKAMDLQKKRLLTQLDKINSQKTILYLAAFLVLIIAVALFIAYKGNKNKQRANALLSKQKIEIEHQRELVEEKQKEIIDSINYAKRIQYSLLASDKLLNQNLPEHFLFFKPKDVVSGDFYWGSKLSNGQFILVTADSTGHGVPGAIMSMLNISCLNEAINADKLTQPVDILNATRRKIIDHLSNDGSEEGGKDGMDCSLCLYDFKNKKLSVSAAHNPVWIIRGNEVIEIKADKMPVGKHDRQGISFMQQDIDLLCGDVIYTLTDGFPDQFGGDRGKKFMSKNLRELLARNAKLPMSDQKELLEKTFSDWIGKLEQVDDVTVIGVRVL